MRNAIDFVTHPLIFFASNSHQVGFLFLLFHLFFKLFRGYSCNSHQQQGMASTERGILYDLISMTLMHHAFNKSNSIFFPPKQNRLPGTDFKRGSAKMECQQSILKKEQMVPAPSLMLSIQCFTYRYICTHTGRGQTRSCPCNILHSPTEVRG